MWNMICTRGMRQRVCRFLMFIINILMIVEKSQVYSNRSHFMFQPDIHMKGVGKSPAPDYISYTVSAPSGRATTMTTVIDGKSSLELYSYLVNLWNMGYILGLYLYLVNLWNMGYILGLYSYIVNLWNMGYILGLYSYLVNLCNMGY